MAPKLIEQNSPLQLEPPTLENFEVKPKTQSKWNEFQEWLRPYAYKVTGALAIAATLATINGVTLEAPPQTTIPALFKALLHSNKPVNVQQALEEECYYDTRKINDQSTHTTTFILDTQKYNIYAIPKDKRSRWSFVGQLDGKGGMDINAEAGNQEQYFGYCGVHRTDGIQLKSDQVKENAIPAGKGFDALLAAARSADYSTTTVMTKKRIEVILYRLETEFKWAAITSLHCNLKANRCAFSDNLKEKSFQINTSLLQRYDWPKDSNGNSIIDTIAFPHPRIAPLLERLKSIF
jgi:hypothetical protein